MLYLLVPWTAINLVDYFFVRRGEYAITDLFTPGGIYGAWGVRGLLAYAIGFFSTIPFFVLPGFYTGAIAQKIGGVDIAWAVGLVVSAVAYLLMTRSLDTSAEKPAIETSEIELASLASRAPEAAGV
jgi:purine-cytosine permease-like protein